MLVNLILFKMSNFDMILGMDFISKYRVEIDCRKKKVRFSLDSKDEFTFGEGQVLSMMISSIKAQKMLNKYWILGVYEQ